MRLSYSLVVAGALTAATPALAQDNSIGSANTVTAIPVDANTGASIAADPATTNTAPDASLSPTAAPVDAAPQETPHRSFPWGVLGLLGLAGLMGVRKARIDDR